MTTRRPQFATTARQGTSHAGLWRDKFLMDQSDRAESGDNKNDNKKTALIAEVATLDEPGEYRPFYDRWVATLGGMGVPMHEATVQGRMAIGLGNEGVLETSISLHHTYGVPIIPGSALKGLAASYADKHLAATEWRRDGAAYVTVFGNTKEAGYITFFDALYKPGSGALGLDNARRALRADVLTVHHRDYYGQGQGISAPADWDSPTIVPFLSATGSYLVALTSVAGMEQWVKETFRILGAALVTMGVGAKTSSGYGRLVVEGYEHAIPRQAQQTATGATPEAGTTNNVGLTRPPVAQDNVPSIAVRTGTGTVMYEKDKSYINEGPGKRRPVNWRDLKMDHPRAKTLVEFDYKDQPDGKGEIVRVTILKKG